MARGEGSSKMLLLVLIGLIGAGGYNYHRNFTAETAVPRPYKGYSVEDLEALRGAYENQSAAVQERYEQARNVRASGSRGGLIDENVRAFEEAQRRSTRSRSLGQALSMNQAAVSEIETELSLRQAEADVVKLHLKRLLTI